MASSERLGWSDLDEAAAASQADAAASDAGTEPTVANWARGGANGDWR